MTPAMPSDAKPNLTPKLRFLEFRNKPAWTGKPMGKVYSFKGNNSLSRDQLNYERGSVKNIHYGDIHTKFSTLFDITKEMVPFINPSESSDGFSSENDCIEGDMIFADASEDLADIGKSIEVVRLNGERLVSGQHTILARPNDDSLVVGFGAYLFKSRRVRTQIQKESQGSKVLGISAARLTKIELPIPSTKAEQQKIADCLSSLDELMGAESQKLDALKAQKKGLMQQLFPRAGETRPRLRFPEFQDAPEWKFKSIGQLGEVVTGSTPSTAVPANYGEDRLFVSPADISDDRFIEKTKTTLTALGFRETRPIKANSILFVCIGSTIGKIAQNRHECATNQQINSVVPNTVNSDGFVYYALSGLADHIANLAGIQAVPIVNKSLFSSVQIAVPELPEQNRIADCLSSLDETIFAQSQKIEALNTHKQGLMQQLFPSTAEVEA
jgi:type I restriction enzyme S subunit